MQEQYGEYVIEYNETRERFEALRGGFVESHSVKLSELKKRLDKAGESEKTFKRVKVFKIGKKDAWSGPEEIIEGEITSIADDGCAWVSWSTGKREKTGSYCSPILDTAENRLIAKDYLNICTAIKSAQKKREETDTLFVRFKKK